MRISDWSADVCASDLVKLVGADTVRDQGLGNAVVLDHGNGWRSYYGHMRRGSIAVKKGDRVQTGQALGLVGMSGLTEFPHLDFAIRRGSTVVDPFIGLPMRSEEHTSELQSLMRISYAV